MVIPKSRPAIMFIISVGAFVNRQLSIKCASTPVEVQVLYRVRELRSSENLSLSEQLVLEICFHIFGALMVIGPTGARVSCRAS